MITGISRGIGKALAKRFLANGDFVIGTSTTGKVDFDHENLIAIKLDLSQSNSIKHCLEKIMSLNKKVDTLINNAAILFEQENDSEKIDTGILKRTLEVNLFGTIDFTEGVISLMNNHGHIVNISSRGGSLNYVHKYFDPSYRISKTAINMFTKLLALRLNGKHTVSSVHPGWVKTDMGGQNADLDPSEAAEDIFKLTNSNPETGQFWFKNEKFPW